MSRNGGRRRSGWIAPVTFALVTTVLAVLAVGAEYPGRQLKSLHHGLTHYHTCLDRLSRQAARTSADPGLLRNPGWRHETMVSLADLHRAGDELRMLEDVPGDLQPYLDALADDTTRMAAAYSQAVSSLTPEDMAEAGARLEKVRQRVAALALALPN